MANYTTDGRYLRSNNGSAVAEFDGTYFRDSQRGTTVGHLYNGTFIHDINGSRIADISGEDLYLADGSRVAMSDVRQAIDGPGGASLAGFWVLFVR